MKTKDLLNKLESLKVEDPDDNKMYITLVSFLLFLNIKIVMQYKNIFDYKIGITPKQKIAAWNGSFLVRSFCCRGPYQEFLKVLYLFI
jgi:hypothetical protein